MKKVKVAALIAGAIVSLSGCTDAGLGKITSLGDSALIKCYSGELLIYEGHSTGKVRNEQSSDGYYFVDRKDGKLKEVSGNCVITYGE